MNDKLIKQLQETKLFEEDLFPSVDDDEFTRRRYVLQKQETERLVKRKALFDTFKEGEKVTVRDDLPDIYRGLVGRIVRKSTATFDVLLQTGYYEPQFKLLVELPIAKDRYGSHLISPAWFEPNELVNRRIESKRGRLIS